MEETKQINNSEDNSDEEVKKRYEDHRQDDEENNLDTAEDPLDKCPPDFEFAKKHREANRVKDLHARKIADKDINYKKMYCSCCGLPTKQAAPELSICSKYTKLEDLGSGFPLYYQLKLFTIVIYLAVFIISGVAGLGIYFSAGSGGEWNNEEDEGNATFSARISIGNYGREKSNYKNGAFFGLQILNTICIFLIIVSSIILRRMQKKVASEIDERVVTPSDFGVMVTGIPLDKTEEEVAEYFKGFFEDLQIVYVNFCYNVKGMIKAVRDLTSNMQIKAYLESYKSKVLKKKGLTEEQANVQGIDTHPPPLKYFC